MVYDPIRNECFKAVRGQGATLNDEPIKTSTTDELDKSLLATGFPYDQRDFADFYLTYFKAFMTRCQGIRRGGSAALDLCYLACGRLDGFWELKLKPWDIAAGSLIVKEAGGMLSDFVGNPFTIWGQETLASNRFIHDEMVRIAARVTKCALTDHRPGDRKIFLRARSEKDITRVSGTLSTGSIPVGRTIRSYPFSVDHDHKRTMGISRSFPLRIKAGMAALLRNVFVALAYLKIAT